MRLIEEHEQLLAKIRPDKQYKIIRPLDEGGSQKNTSVYECVSCTEDIANAPHLAVKIITVKYGRNEDKRFRRQQAANEISLLNKLNRPGVSNHIIGLIDYTILDMDNKDEGFYLVLFMPVFKSLADLENEHINDTQEEALVLIKKLALDISEALRICHQNGIVHRDLKPENIFVNEEGDFLLADFGFAKELQDTGSVTSVGTENYAAPEVIRHETEPTQKGAMLTDIYSFGVVLYQIANHWTLPFYPAYPAKYTAADAAKAHYTRVIGNQNLALPDNCPMEIGRFITKMCSHNPKERPQTIEEVESAFLSYFDITQDAVSQSTVNAGSGHLNDFLAAMAVYKKIEETILVHMRALSAKSKKIRDARQGTDEEIARYVSDFVEEAETIKELCTELGYSKALNKCRYLYSQLFPEEQQTQEDPNKYEDIEKETVAYVDAISHIEQESFYRAEKYSMEQESTREKSASYARAPYSSQQIAGSSRQNNSSHSDAIDNTTGYNNSVYENVTQQVPVYQEIYPGQTGYSFNDTPRRGRRKVRVKKKVTPGRILLIAVITYLLSGVVFGVIMTIKAQLAQKKEAKEAETIAENTLYHTMSDAKDGNVPLYTDATDVANRTYDTVCELRYDKSVFDVSNYERFVGYVVMGKTNSEDTADVYFYVDDKNEEVAKVTVGYDSDPVKIDLDLRGISELTILQDRQKNGNIRLWYPSSCFYFSYEEGNSQANEECCPYRVIAASGYIWDMPRWQMHMDGMFEKKEDVTTPNGERYCQVYFMRQFMSNWGMSAPAVYPLTGAYSRFITYIMPAEDDSLSGEMFIRTDIGEQSLTIPVSGNMEKCLIDMDLTGANWLTISFSDDQTRVYLYEPRFFVSEEEANEYLSTLDSTPDYISE